MASLDHLVVESPRTLNRVVTVCQLHLLTRTLANGVEIEEESYAHQAKAYEDTGVRNADAGAVESALVEQALWPGHRGQEPRAPAGDPMVSTPGPPVNLIESPRASLPPSRERLRHGESFEC